VRLRERSVRRHSADGRTTEQNGYRARGNRLANVAAAHYRAGGVTTVFAADFVVIIINNNITPIWVEAFAGPYSAAKSRPLDHVLAPCHNLLLRIMRRKKPFSGGARPSRPLIRGVGTCRLSCGLPIPLRER